MGNWGRLWGDRGLQKPVGRGGGEGLKGVIEEMREYWWDKGL